MDYQISRTAVAKLVAYPYRALDDVPGTAPDAPARNARWLATLAATTVSVAVTRQWAVDELGDETASAKMRELNRAEIDGFIDGVIDPASGRRLGPQVPEGPPAGTHWEWTGAGWMLVLPPGAKLPIPGEVPPQPEWSPEDLIAAGVQFLRAAQETPGTALRDVLETGAQRLIDTGMSRLGT